jgi:monoamine oxidase
MKPTRTPIARMLGQAYRKALASTKHKTAEPEINEQAKKISRKDFFSNTVMASAAVALPSVLQSCNTNTGATGSGVSKDISIAIIGAGVAGLNAAHQLNKLVGIKATIYEASKRTGGRMMTANNLMAPGITTELGGEFIDSTHKDILDLIDEFGLEKMDCVKDVKDNHLAEHTFFFGGKIRSGDEVAHEFSKYAEAIQADKQKLDDGDETRIAELDKLQPHNICTK